MQEEQDQCNIHKKLYITLFSFNFLSDRDGSSAVLVVQLNSMISARLCIHMQKKECIYVEITLILNQLTANPRFAPLLTDNYFWVMF